MRPTVLIGLLLSGIGAAAQVVGDPWREAPNTCRCLRRRAPARAAYRIVHLTARPQATLRRLEADAFARARTRSLAGPRPILPLDAFGLAGRYDRSALARVYGARQPHVARGARMENGRVVESWTLISPYPDTALRRLETGTLLVVLRLP